MFYQHYKGGFYKVLCIATDESDGRVMVVYQSLQDGRVWLRRASNFFEKIQPPGHPAPFPRFQELSSDPREKPASAQGQVVRVDPRGLPAGQ